MKIKCIVTDDEPIARKGLCGYIEKIDYLSLIGECEDALQLNNLLKTEQPDLLFLDSADKIYHLLEKESGKNTSEFNSSNPITNTSSR